MANAVLERPTGEHKATRPAATPAPVPGQRAAQSAPANLANAEPGPLEPNDAALAEGVPAEGSEEAVEGRGAFGSFLATLRHQFRNAPWWVISAVVHTVILLLLSLIVTTINEKDEDDIIITTDLTQKKEEREKPKRRDLFKQLKQVEMEDVVENPVFTHEKVEITDHVETENDMDLNTARGHEEAISDIPLGGTGVVGSIGVGGGGGGVYGFRTGGGRRKAVSRFGGSTASESAVDAALEWLARHQEPDGRWDCRKYEGGGDHDVSMTGLALLAFLGAGHTERAGKYKHNVRLAVKWLVANQKGKGNWVRLMYENGIAALALAEAYGMARNPKVGKAAQQAIDYITEIAQHKYMAWNYGASRDTHARNDTSVSGWQVMALKSAKVAGLAVPGEAFQGAINWLDAGQDLQGADDMTSDWKGGRMAYAGTKAEPKTGQGGIAMTAAAALMRQFMGWARQDPAVLGPANLLMDKLPGAGAVNFYYWYYATLVMFQMGGDHWNAWNNAMRPTLLNMQRKGGDENGSWDPVGGGGVAKKGGRVMSTALAALCMEVYYRYLPIYKK